MIRHIETYIPANEVGGVQIDTITQVLSLRRDGSGGFIISTVDTTINGYNDPNLYIFDRQIDIITASKVTTDPVYTNTVVTNDGLIAIYRDTNVLEIIDIFEQDTVTYQSLLADGHDELDSYNEYINPSNKRVFIVNGTGTTGVPAVLSVKNSLQFISGTEYHFSSQMDYNLPVDAYNLYITTEALWNSTYAETSNFQFLKKPAFKIIGKDTLTVTLAGEDSTIDLNQALKPVYRLKYLDIDAVAPGDDGAEETVADKYINFTISSEFSHGYIYVY